MSSLGAPRQNVEVVVDGLGERGGNHGNGLVPSCNGDEEMGAVSEETT